MRGLAIGILLASAPLGAFAQSGGRDGAKLNSQLVEAATRLVQAQGVREQYEQAGKRIALSSIQRVMAEFQHGTKDNSAKQAEAFRRVRPLVETEVLSVMREVEPGMLSLSAEIYARNFSLSELRAITAFYESPAGRSFVAKQAKFSRDTSEAVARLMAPAMERHRAILGKKIDAALADLK